MRRLGWALALTAAVVTAGTVAAHARWQRPRISPRDTVKATIDGSNISMEYGRPSKRGRVIWGSLVPWNHWWMPGADESSTITTDATIVIANTLTMPAGTHTIYTLPGEHEFKLIISKEVGTFHTQYHPDQDLGRVDMTLRKLTEPVEQMTFLVEPHEGGGGVFKLVWDDREYSVPITIKR
ncbi:MAG TPA: DUF2911 domain-containing protein [Vicinamibacterales bacterium]|nr:DUF2911 domain-containing protein [Vicinamibacterales bacterium]